MGLFSRKKAEPAAAPASAPVEKKSSTMVNPDDIWGTPKKKTNKFADESTEAMNEPVSIDPETVKKKMAAMERELEEQKNKPAAAYEPISQVQDDEVVSAQAKYEEQYKIEHERYIASHQQDIEKAIGDENRSEVDKRISDIVEERDRRAEETAKILGDIKETDPDQIRDGMNKLGVAKDETLDPDYQNINEVAGSEVEQKLGELGVAKDETLDPDYKNIKELSAQDVEAKTKEFLEMYGDRKRED